MGGGLPLSAHARRVVATPSRSHGQSRKRWDFGSSGVFGAGMNAWAIPMNAEFETETSGTETSETGKSYHT